MAPPRFVAVTFTSKNVLSLWSWRRFCHAVSSCVEENEAGVNKPIRHTSLNPRNCLRFRERSLKTSPAAALPRPF